MSNINDPKQGKRVGIIVIILMIVMIILTIYEFVSCLNGSGDTWKYDHL